MQGAETKNKSSFLRSKLLLVLMNLVSVACLYFALKDANLSQLAGELEKTNWGWVTIAVISDILVYFWHGWRWSLLLSPLAEVPFWRSVRAIYVGLFANEILPFRTGEVIRCYLLARWTELPLTVALSSALIERIFDGIWLVICLLVTLRFVKLPGYVVDAGVVLAVVVLCMAALLAVAMFYKQQTRAAFANNRILSKLNVLIEDLHIIGHSRFLYFSAFASLPYLLMQVVPIYAIARGYPGFDLSIGQAAALMVILRLGSVVPQAPGNLGIFQSITIVGLVSFGIERSMAARFSVLMWGVITLPLLVVGTLAFAITGMRIRELQHQAQTSVKQSRTD